jgi:hypothetical protein
LRLPLAADSPPLAGLILVSIQFRITVLFAQGGPSRKGSQQKPELGGRKVSKDMSRGHLE